jgi:elongation factor 3
MPRQPILTCEIGSEIWQVADGKVTQKGKVAVIEDAFAETKSPKGSGAQTPAGKASRAATPAASAAATPAGSGGEGTGTPPPMRKKKKLTRNQLKEQAERRKKRKLDWLISGGPKPEDTDEDD